MSFRTATTRRQDEESALVGIMHLARGSNSAPLPSSPAMKLLPLAAGVADFAVELDELIATERQLIYIAATQARDRLFVSYAQPGSEFFEGFS